MGEPLSQIHVDFYLGFQNINKTEIKKQTSTQTMQSNP